MAGLAPIPPFSGNAIVPDCGRGRLLSYGSKMPPTKTVISEPPATLSAYEGKLIERVRKYGWQTTSVGTDDSGDPAFSYTTGFWLTVDQPEVIVFDFPPQLSHDVFGQMMRLARSGQRFPMAKPIEGILINEAVYLFPLKREAAVEYLRSSQWFYKKTDFPAVQLVWTDPAGRFPWDSDFDPPMKRMQPDISARGWETELGAAT